MGSIHRNNIPKMFAGYPCVRCNRWQLYTAHRANLRVEKVRFVCLWNGEGWDGPDGTAHMYNEVKRRKGLVTWIDIRQT